MAGSPLSNQVRTWAMWFCDVAIRNAIGHARAWPAELAGPAPAIGRVLWR